MVEKRKWRFPLLCVFPCYILNMDISSNIVYPLIKFDMLLLHVIMEGTVSQILYLGPSFYFMKSTKISFMK